VGGDQWGSLNPEELGESRVTNHCRFLTDSLGPLPTKALFSVLGKTPCKTKSRCQAKDSENANVSLGDNTRPTVENASERLKKIAREWNNVFYFGTSLRLIVSEILAIRLTIMLRSASG